MKETQKRIPEWIRQRKNEILAAIAAFCGTYGLCYLGKLAGMEKITFSFCSICFWAVLLFAWRRLLRGTPGEPENYGSFRPRRVAVFAFGVAGLLALSLILGYQLQNYGFTFKGLRGKAGIVVNSLLLSAAFFPGTFLFFGPVCQSIREVQVGRIPEEAVKGQEGAEKRKGGAGSVLRSRRVFLLSALAIFFLLVPVWLAYYPLIMSYDFHRQINEAAKGFQWFYPYQPIAHTWVIWVFYRLGKAVGSLETGMACMALFQMVLYSLVTAYAVSFLHGIFRKKWIPPVMVAFFGLFPLNSVLVVCSTKDVIFSVLFLLFFLLLLKRSYFASGRRQWILDICLVLTGALMMQFRNNAIYAVAVFGVFWVLFAGKKKRLRILLLCLLLVAGGRGMKAGIKLAIGTKLPDAKLEMYSVPIQMFGRVASHHQEDLDPETDGILSYYMAKEMWDHYNPPIADTMRGTIFHPERITEHVGDLARNLLKVGSKYPEEFADAFLDLTRGYWFWDDRSAVECLGFGPEGRMGTIYTYTSTYIDMEEREILHRSKLPILEEFLEKIVSENIYYQWPVLSIPFRCAFYCWAMFLVFLVLWYRRNGESLLYVLFPFLYFGTMLLGPVVQVRYIYPIMLTLPLMIALVFVRNTREGKKQQ